MTSKETESVTKNLATNNSLGTDDFSGELYQMFKELIPILLNSSERQKRRELF